MTTKRTALIMKQVALTAERLRERETMDRAEIVNQNAVRGMLQSGQTIYQRHDVLVRTLHELLRFRMDVEASTPRTAEDQDTWYKDLTGSIWGISDAEIPRVLQALTKDHERFGGGPLSDGGRDDVVRRLTTLRDQFLKEAEILHDARALEAQMPKPNSGQHVTLNINAGSIANLNLGTQIGQIQSTVEALQGLGLQDVAAALKALTESIVAASDQSLAPTSKTEAVQLVATLGEEFTKQSSERRMGVVRAVAGTLKGLVVNVDKVAAAYELVKVVARTQGVELP